MRSTLLSRIRTVLAAGALLPVAHADLLAADPPSKASSAWTAIASKQRPVVEYYGDSTVWGFATGSGSQVAVPAPAAFADALSSRVQVANRGVSGTTACQLLNGTDGVHPPWDKQMAASPARFVIINHAINDQWKYDVATYKSCLQQLAQTAKQSGKKVILETPNPIVENDGLVKYVRAMKEVASSERLAVIDQFRYLTDYLKGRSPSLICPDGLHPTDAVYVMKGRYAAQVFSALHPAK